MATPYNVSHIPSPPPELVPHRWLPNWLTSRIPNPIRWVSNNNRSNHVANEELFEPSDRLHSLINNPKRPIHEPSATFASNLDVGFHLELEPDSDSEFETNSELEPEPTTATTI